MRVPRHVLYQAFAAFTASTTIFVTGIWCAWPSVMLPKLKRGEIPIGVSEEDLSWITALLDLGSFLSPYPLSSYLVDQWGRVLTMRISAIGFAVSSIILLTATTVLPLYTARFMAGLSLGFAYSAAPMYVAEIAHPDNRGVLTGTIEFSFQAAIACTMTFGPFIAPYTLHLILLVLPVNFLILSFFIPETPYFLCMRDDSGGAEKALGWFRDTRAVTANKFEINTIKERIAEEKRQEASIWALFSTRASRRALKILLVTNLVLGLGGISSITDFGSTSLPTRGFWDPTFTMIIFGWSELVCSFLSSLLIDKVGRRPLLVFSVTSICLIEGVIAVFFYFYQKTDLDVTAYSFVPHLGNILVASLVCLGEEQTILLYRSELFPTHLRSKATALAGVFWGLSYFLTNKIFLPVGSSVGFYAMYLVFSAVNFCGLLFVLFNVFETKGKSFAEIQDILSQ